MNLKWVLTLLCVYLQQSHGGGEAEQQTAAVFMPWVKVAGAGQTPEILTAIEQISGLAITAHYPQCEDEACKFDDNIKLDNYIKFAEGIHNRTWELTSGIQSVLEGTATEFPQFSAPEIAFLSAIYTGIQGADCVIFFGFRGIASTVNGILKYSHNFEKLGVKNKPIISHVPVVNILSSEEVEVQKGVYKAANIIRLTSLTSSYLNGVVGAVHSVTANNEIGIVTFKTHPNLLLGQPAAAEGIFSPLLHPEAADAFFSGAMDSLKSPCIKKLVIDASPYIRQNDKGGAVLDYTRLVSFIQEETARKLETSDIVFSLLGDFYDHFAHWHVKNKIVSGYGMYGVIGMHGFADKQTTIVQSKVQHGALFKFAVKTLLDPHPGHAFQYKAEGLFHSNQVTSGKINLVTDGFTRCDWISTALWQEQAGPALAKEIYTATQTTLQEKKLCAKEEGGTRPTALALLESIWLNMTNEGAAVRSAKATDAASTYDAAKKGDTLPPQMYFTNLPSIVIWRNAFLAHSSFVRSTSYAGSSWFDALPEAVTSTNPKDASETKVCIPFQPKVLGNPDGFFARLFAPKDASKGQIPRFSNATVAVMEGCDQQEKNVDKKNVRLVGVGVYINNLGNVDMKSGSFYVDYNLYLHQSKQRYLSIADAESQLSEGPSCSQKGSTAQPCECPILQENQWENYIPPTTKDLSDHLNLVNVDRVKIFTKVLRDVDETGRDSSTSGLEQLVDFYRVQAVHYFTPNLRNWPIDTQSLNILLEDMQESNTENTTLRFCHLGQYSGFSPTARYFPGMELSVGARPWEAEITTSCWPSLKYPDAYVEGQCEDPGRDVRFPVSEYSNADLTCSCLGGRKSSSRYSFSLTFERPPVQSFMKAFLPAIFIVVVNLGVYFLYPKVFETRLGVCGSSLISGVMYHVSLTSYTPDHTVMTWADRFMVAVYFNNVMAFILVFLQTVLYQGGYSKIAWWCFKLTRVWGPLAAVVSFLGVAKFDTMGQVVIWIVVSSGLLFLLCCCALLPCIDAMAPYFLKKMKTIDKASHLKRNLRRETERQYRQDPTSDANLLDEEDEEELSGLREDSS